MTRLGVGQVNRRATSAAASVRFAKISFGGAEFDPATNADTIATLDDVVTDPDGFSDGVGLTVPTAMDGRYRLTGGWEWGNWDVGAVVTFYVGHTTAAAWHDPNTARIGQTMQMYAGIFSGTFTGTVELAAGDVLRFRCAFTGTRTFAQCPYVNLEIESIPT